MRSPRDGRSRALDAAQAVMRNVLADPRHPMSPAAVRVERTSSRGDRGSAHQTALTVWFREGPALPSPGSGPSVRGVVTTVAGLAGVVALGALGVIASQRELRGLAQPPPVRHISAAHEDSD